MASPTDAPGPSRPQTLDFLKLKDPGRAATLTWTHPGPKCVGFTVYATSNPFPPQMAAQLFAGKMKAFIDEEKLDARAKELRVARSEKFYAVVWHDDEGNAAAVADLKEPEEVRDVFIDLKAVAATQVRTYVRLRYLPGIVEFRDAAVHVWVRDVEPNKTALNKMASGEVPADYVLPVKGDGFVDTGTEPEWRKFYVALAVGKDGVRRPLGLEAGGYVRLEDPQFLEKEGRKRYEEIVELVRNQLEVDLQRKTLTLEDVRASLKKADDLAPFHPTITRLKQKARERFGTI